MEKSALGSYLQGGVAEVPCPWVGPSPSAISGSGAAGSPGRGLPLGIFLEEQSGAQLVGFSVVGVGLGTGTPESQGGPGDRVSVSLPARHPPFSQLSSERQKEALGLADLHKLGLASVHSRAAKEPGDACMQGCALRGQ